ncbi:MAG: pyridoxal phosphate-dependent aminotransferase [Clostridia bacterium]|nr:pyridoxal phosphate-dependent aminotransferase [Clostridia bacterium]
MELARRARGISPSPTLTIDTRAKEMKAAGANVINFGVGEPDFDTPEHIKEVAVSALQAGMTKYTAVSGIIELRRVIAKKLQDENGLSYKPEEIIVSVGAKHSLYNAFQVLCQEGDEVILPEPYWVSYLEQIKLCGARPVLVKTTLENGFKLTPDQLRGAITPRSRLLVLNSPSNPTGAVYSRRELEGLADVILTSGIGVISDEIYEKLVYDGKEHVSIASLDPKLKKRTVVINGVSKAYAMTGWRIGYAAAPLRVTKAMTDLQSHSTSNPTSIAQAAAVSALAGDQEALQEMLRKFAERREYILERLTAIDGVQCSRPGGAFYVFPHVGAFWGKQYRGTEMKSGTDLARLLLEERQVALIPGIAFGDDDYIRLSYATDLETIREGLDRIEAVLKELR